MTKKSLRRSTQDEKRTITSDITGRDLCNIGYAQIKLIHKKRSPLIFIGTVKCELYTISVRHLAYRCYMRIPLY